MALMHKLNRLEVLGISFLGHRAFASIAHEPQLRLRDLLDSNVFIQAELRQSFFSIVSSSGFSSLAPSPYVTHTSATFKIVPG